MDLVIEFIGEILLEGTVEIIKNKNISWIFRLLAVLVFSIFILGIGGLLIYLAFMNMKNNLWLGLILVILGLIILGVYGWWLYKVLIVKE